MQLLRLFLAKLMKQNNEIQVIMTVPEEEAKSMIVRGFAEPISRELPLEYAVEMNRLIDMELEGANG